MLEFYNKWAYLYMDQVSKLQWLYQVKYELDQFKVTATFPKKQVLIAIWCEYFLVL